MAINHLIRQNVSIYANSNSDKELILQHLKNKISKALNESSTPIGEKNLVYFTIFKEESYLDLLEICLKSIHKFAEFKTFDLLFITEESFVDKIKSFQILQNFNFDFFLLPRPVDGVAASMKKLKIFKYAKINEYKNILFLDCDIISTANLNHIFAAEYNPEYLQVACNPSLNYKVWSHRAVFWNLDYMTQEQSDFIEATKPTPFNAGQFYFCNSKRMNAHFSNVIWLSEVWPGEYFFEQSFMNFYFIFNNLCERTIINNICRFINIGPIKRINLNGPAENIPPIGYVRKHNGKFLYTVEKNEEIEPEKNAVETLNDSYYLIHFIGLALFASSKKVYIENFLNKNNLCL
jgi:hypothetical protein